jgi:hypothetical protein
MVKYVHYFYMGVAEREMEKDINDLLEKVELALKNSHIEITSLGIKSFETDDIKMLNAFVKAKAEEAKAISLYTTRIGFGLGILTLLLRELIAKYFEFGIGILGLLFILIICASIYEEKKYRQKIERLYYLSGLLEIYKKEKEDSESGEVKE